MVQPCTVEGLEQAIDAMITLTRLSNLHRTIVAGSESTKLCIALRRRGFVRIVTPTVSRVLRRQHSIALIAGEASLKTIEDTLTQVGLFLTDHATLAILICSREGEFCQRIRKKLEQMGFSIEAGVRCQEGLVLSAYRHGFHQAVGKLENAA
jgi:hypothetical protein